jgi:hypothetical protein
MSGDEGTNSTNNHASNGQLLEGRVMIAMMADVFLIVGKGSFD